MARLISRMLSFVFIAAIISGCGGGGGGGTTSTTSASTSTTTSTSASPTPAASTSPTPTTSPTASPSPTATPSPGTLSAAGLSELNMIRGLSGLPALTEDTALSAGDQLHSVYMVKNNVITHAEDPTKPFFTTAGDTAGKNSNVFATTSPTLTIQAAIDSLMVGPFHGIGFIDPRLLQTGFGLDSENMGSNSVIQSAAAIDVLSDRASTTTATFPIVWPGPNSTSPFATYSGNESPDPLTSLAGFVAPTGAPILVQLGPGNVTPSVTAFSVKVNGTAVAAGEFDQTNYTNPDSANQTTARAVLAARSAVVIMPKLPLTKGATVQVSLTANGSTTNWSFTVSSTAQ